MDGDNKKTILLVEDEAVTSMAQKSALENYGYTVITADSGQKAIAAVKTDSEIDLILMDIDLGEDLDGADIALVIVKRREIPILFLSSHSEPEIVEKTEKIRSYGYVVKNTGITVLDASIKMAFKLFEAERKTASARDKLEAIFDQSPVGSVIMGLDKRFIRCNSAFCNFIRCKEDELTGKIIHSVSFTDDPGLWSDELDQIAGRKIESHISEKRYILKDGATVWGENHIRLIRDGCGEPIYFSIVIRDISGRKYADEALHLSESRYRSIIEDQNEFICRYLPDGRLSFVNGAYARYYKKDQNELIDKNYIPQIPDPDLTIVLKKLAEITRDNPVVEYTHRIINSIGEIRWQRWTQRGIFSDDGTLLEYQAMGFDITVEKEAMDKIRSLLSEKEMLLKEVHHRIKNNMNTIKMLIYLQRLALTDTSAVSALMDTESRIDSMLLLYSELFCSDNLNAISVLKYFPPLICSIVANFSNSTLVKIENKFDDFILDVKILQPLGILVNELLTNTMKYAFTGRNSGLITVSASLKDNRVIFIVDDNGIGLPESFDFKNSDGFGMQLVYMLTEQIKGVMRIERIEGTKFILEFNI